MPLLKAEFECEVLTPMFLSGVDQTACELRAPTLRGAMRYWYRALLGGQGKSLAEMKKLEASVFGATDLASPVVVRLDGLKLSKDPIRAGQIPRFSESVRISGKEMGSPVKYLWYSINMNPNDRRAIPPDSTFRVVLHTVATGKHAEARRKAFERALDAFWLVAHLGSLGTRARRAAGSFSARLVSRTGDFALPPFHEQGRFEDSKVLRHLRDLIPQPQGGSPDWSVLGKTSRVWRARLDTDSWTNAVWDIGAEMREFRLRLGSGVNPSPAGFPNDYEVMKRAVQNNQAPSGSVGRASFGLPLTFRFSNVRGQKTLEPEGRGNDRRASPLWIRIVRLPNGRYDAVLTHLGGRFLPHGMEARGTNGRVPAPDKSLVPHFVTFLGRGDNPKAIQLYPLGQ